MITQTTHVVALVTPELLNPTKPTDSPLFEKAANIQKAFDCKLTMLHMTPPHSMGRSIEETLAFKVLIRRVNLKYQTDFDAHTETAKLNLKSIDQIFHQLGGDLLVREAPIGGDVDSTTISLLESAPYPIWYICNDSQIGEINAKIADTAQSKKDDILTCTVAQDLGEELGSEVGIIQSAPSELIAGDLVVACVPTPEERQDRELDLLRREAIQMLRSPLNHDLLVHRGADIDQLPMAA